MFLDISVYIIMETNEILLDDVSKIFLNSENTDDNKIAKKEIPKKEINQNNFLSKIKDKKIKLSPKQKELEKYGLDDFEYDLVKKRTISKIFLYYDTFPHKLGEKKPQNLDNKSLSKLDQMLSNCKILIGTKSLTKLLNNGISMGTDALEKFCVLLGLQLQGFSKELLDDQDFMDTVKEIILDYSDDMYISPFTRLAMCIISKGRQVQNKNISEIQKRDQNKDVKKFENKFSHL